MSKELREGRGRVQSVPEGESQTRQSEAESCDINVILRNWKRTGVVNHLNRSIPAYGDVSMAVSLHEAIELVDAADDEFMRLPAAVRAAAQNDPVRLLEMVADPEGRELLVEAGLDVNRPAESGAEPQTTEAPVPPEGGTPSEPAPEGATS